MSESSGFSRPGDPPTAYRDPLATTTDAYATSGSATGTSTTTDTAKQQAGRVGGEAKASGAHVAEVAKDQAAGVAQEAKSQAKGLLSQAGGELKGQVGSQQQRAATGLRTLGEQLGGLASGSPQPGLATDLAKQAGDRVSAVAQWVEARDPADLLQEVTRFARRRPGAFLGLAATVGLVAGRLTRGVAANSHEESESRSSGTTGYGTTGYGTGGYGTTGTTGTDAYATTTGSTYTTTETYAPASSTTSTTSTTSGLGGTAEPPTRRVAL